MLKYLLFTIVILAFYQPTFSQTTFSSATDKINQTDNQGKKQGYWEMKFPNGNLRYKGFFKNNKPIGEFTRFYDTGVVQAIMIFDELGTKARATLFYNNGEKAATGNYINTKKDSIWEYYSFYTNNRIAKETFKNGVRHGISIIYFENGRHFQELNWQNDQKHGAWKQFYENGNIKVQGNYINNQKSGPFTTFYIGGLIDTKGNYINGSMEGFWEFYDEEGKLLTKIEYVNGRPVNEEELIRNQQELFKMIESRRGKIPEPDESGRFVQ